MNKQAERASQHTPGRTGIGSKACALRHIMADEKHRLDTWAELLAALHEVAYQLGVGISDYDGGEPRFMDKVRTAIVAAEGTDAD